MPEPSEQRPLADHLRQQAGTEGLQTLVGLAGESDDPAATRIYLSPNLDVYIDVATDPSVSPTRIPDGVIDQATGDSRCQRYEVLGRVLLGRRHPSARDGRGQDVIGVGRAGIEEWGVDKDPVSAQVVGDDGEAISQLAGAPFVTNHQRLGHQPAALVAEALPAAGILGQPDAGGQSLGEGRHLGAKLLGHVGVDPGEDVGDGGEIPLSHIDHDRIATFERQQVFGDLDAERDRPVVQSRGGPAHEVQGPGRRQVPVEADHGAAVGPWATLVSGGQIEAGRDTEESFGWRTATCSPMPGRPAVRWRSSSSATHRRTPSLVTTAVSSSRELSVQPSSQRPCPWLASESSRTKAATSADAATTGLNGRSGAARPRQ